MPELKKTIEEIVPITVSSGQDVQIAKFTPPAGKWLRAVLHFDDPVPSPGFTRIYIKDAAGEEIVKNQTVQSLRTRDVQFEKDGKAVNVDTKGRTFFMTIQSTSAMTQDFNAELVLIYADPNQDCAL